MTDNGNCKIQIFSSDGTYLRSFGRIGDKQEEFHNPVGIAFDNYGHIVVVDGNNHRVQVFSEQGEFLSQFGEQGSLDHQLYWTSMGARKRNIVLFSCDRAYSSLSLFHQRYACLRSVNQTLI